ncbi:MAG: hypothetical protein V4612_06725 [Pseudomonadota bacterium]
MKRFLTQATFSATRTIQPTYQSSFRTFSSRVDGRPLHIDIIADAAKKSRIEELRAKLRADTPRHIFEISRQGQGFLGYVNNNLNKRYSRGGKAGEGLIGVSEVVQALQQSNQSYYDDAELSELLDGSEEVQSRMRVKVSESYLNHALKIPKGAKKANPILKVVMPSPREIDDLSGEVDPSNQNRYSPLPGLIHKYGMLLAFVSINCSSHCRYCYRLDLFNGSSGKEKADMPVIAAYIKTFNSLIDEEVKNSGEWDKESGLWIDKKTREPLAHIREMLFSGGDPMTLPNATIARYLVLMAEAGIEKIRFGTKDLVFNPQRFDEEFWEMMDLFHKNYPDVKVDIIGHYVHPFELLEPRIDKNGEYVYDTKLKYKVREDLKPVFKEINKRRDWVWHYNQLPIIAGINDSPEVMQLLMYYSSNLGIQMHNIYACREIVGNKHFRGFNTIERQFQLIEKSKSALSGLEDHGRLMMSTEYGKIEIVEASNGKVFLKIGRFIQAKKPDNTLIIVDTSKLPEGQKFYWLTDEVIEMAVDEQGKKTLAEIGAEDQSLVKQLKKLAAEQVQQNLTTIPDDPLKPKPPKKPCSTKLEIEVVSRNGSEIIEVDLSDEIYSKKSPTLATILSKKGFIEAACDEQLSCSTCVGEVESSEQLPEATEDEKDLIDMAESELRKMGIKPSKSPNLRATCEIPVKAGQSYKFTSLDTQNKDGSRS